MIQGSTLKQMCHLCVKGIKKPFWFFAKMKLEPNVRDVNDAKQIWLLTEIALRRTYIEWLLPALLLACLSSLLRHSSFMCIISSKWSCMTVSPLENYDHQPWYTMLRFVQANFTRSKLHFLASSHCSDRNLNEQKTRHYFWQWFHT